MVRANHKISQTDEYWNIVKFWQQFGILHTFNHMHFFLVQNENTLVRSLTSFVFNAPLNTDKLCVIYQNLCALKNFEFFVVKTIFLLIFS